MAVAVPIHQGQDFYVPYFEVKLDGRPLGKAVMRDVLQVSYTDDIEQIDRFEFTVNNWDAEKLTFKYSDKKLFDPGKTLELWMGYYGKDRLRLMLRGKITEMRPSFPSGGSSTLAISGLNVLHDFRQQQEQQAYERVTDSEIARQIGGRRGVTVRTDQTAAANEETYEYLFQENENDVVFLMERARRLGYDLFVEEGGQNGQAGESRLYFGPSENVRQIVYELEYGKSLIEFQPTITVTNQVGEVTLRSWDTRQKRPIEYTARLGSTGIRSVGGSDGRSGVEQAFQARREIISDQPVESEAEARRIATETLKRINKEIIKGSGSTVGLPDLRAGSVLQIKGLGTRFSGRYFVTSTTHAIDDSGYTTKFQGRREEK